MARPTNKQETKSLEISVPLALYEYLSYLAAHSRWGASESAVAVYLLTKQVDTVAESGSGAVHLPRGPSTPVT